MRKTNLVIGTADRECLKCHETPGRPQDRRRQARLPDRRQGRPPGLHPPRHPLRQVPLRRRSPAGPALRAGRPGGLLELPRQGGRGVLRQRPRPGLSPEKARRPLLHRLPRQAQGHAPTRTRPTRPTGRTSPSSAATATAAWPPENAARNPQGNVLVNYSESVHGQGLTKKGLLPVAVCTDCHNTHFILKPPIAPVVRRRQEHSRPPAPRATRGSTRTTRPASTASRQSKSDKKLPNCEDCHSAHRIQDIKQDQFMTEVTQQCGSLPQGPVRNLHRDDPRQGLHPGLSEGRPLLGLPRGPRHQERERLRLARSASSTSSRPAKNATPTPTAASPAT